MAGGRPTKYKEDYARQAEIACREGGMINPALAKLFDVALDTIKEWMKVHPEFSAAIKRGKDDFNTMSAEDSLLKRVMGYQFTETIMEPDSKTGEMTIAKETIKSVAPDVTAQIFFLKNRNRERWNDKKDVDLNVTGLDDVLASLKTAPLVEDDD